MREKKAFKDLTPEHRLIPYHPSDLTGKRVLVLAPHPDDETFGCGGTLALHRRAGDPVKVIFLTNGGKGNFSGKTEKQSYIAIRQNEAVKACGVFDIADIEFWRYEDRFLIESFYSAVEKLVQAINTLKPELIYLPSPLELHPDHRATATIFEQAVKEYSAYFQAAFYEVGYPLFANTLIDITSVIDLKSDAIQAYKSQLKERPYGDYSLGLSRFRTITLPEHVKYAEAFSVWNSKEIWSCGGIRSLLMSHMEKFYVHGQYEDAIQINSQPAADTDMSEYLKDNHPLVSVVIRTKDRPERLRTAIQSVASQTYRQVEVILVNDGGSTPDISGFKDILKDFPLKYVELEKNMGRPYAANTGIDHADGAYICFLDDDDIYYPNHIMSLIYTALNNESQVVYSSVQAAFYTWADNQKSDAVMIKKSHLYNFSFNPSRLLFENYIPLNALMFSKSMLMENRFDEMLEINEDWNLLVRLSRKCKFYHVNDITAEYRLFPGDDDHGDISDYLKKRHSKWIRIAFDKHKQYIAGDDWDNFYSEYLLPKHNKELQDIRNEKDDQIRKIGLRYENELNNQKKELLTISDQRIKEIVDAYEDELRNQKQELLDINEHRTKDISDTYENELANLKSENQIKVKQVTESYEKEIANIQKSLIEEKQHEINEIRCEYEDRLQKVFEEFHRVRHQLDIVLTSKSWKITFPLRYSRRVLDFVLKGIRYVFNNHPAKSVRRALLGFYNSPLSSVWLRWVHPSIKQYVKSFIFRNNEPVTIFPISDHPKVSLIIPVYNHARYLDRCIQSAVCQDYRDTEIVIVDDASPDPAVRTILDKYKNDPRVRLYFNDLNMGISHTLNQAIIHSSGEIIAFLDCDDYLTDDAVSASLKHWSRSTVYLHTARTNVDENNQFVQRISFEHLPRQDYFAENLERMYATHFKMIKKEVFSHVGMFDTRFDSAQDYDMLMRIAFHYPSDSFVFVPEFVYFHRLHDKQATCRYENRQTRHTATIQHEAQLRKNISEGYFEKGISIIMLSFGKHEQTLEAVQSLVDTVNIPFEIILFDNGSDRKTVHFLKNEIARRFPFVKMYFNDTNLGTAEGRRQALKHATGPYYITFDNDEIAQPGWIEELLVRGEADSTIGAVGARVFYPDNRLQFSGGFVRHIDEELIELGRYDMDQARFDSSTSVFRECDWLPIGATLFKVNPSKYLHSGYQNIFEDAGVSFGLKKDGYRLVNSPGSLVLHNHFIFMDNFSMKKKYLEARYNKNGMLKALASFYAENNLIIYDEYVWRENGLNKLSRNELKQKLRELL